MYQLWISPLREDTFGRSTQYSFHTFITKLETVARFSVTNTDGTKYWPWKEVFWCELNRLSSSERRWSKIGTVLVLQNYIDGLDAGMPALWCWWPNIMGIDGAVPISVHILETVSNHLWWYELIFSLICLSDDVKVSISDTACKYMSLVSSWRLVVRPLRYYRHSLVFTGALVNSVLVIISNRVLASVTESEDNMQEPSAEIFQN